MQLKGNRKMNDDAHLVVATATGAGLLGWTLETWLLILWMVYVSFLILKTLPDVIDKYPFIKRAWSKFLNLMRWKRGKGGQ